LFVNGVMVDEGSPASMSQNDSRLYVGKDELDAGIDTDDRYWFTGNMDEMRVSTSVRYVADFTPEERFETDENTLFLWHLDETSGGVAQDAASNHHAAVKNTVWSDLTICDL